jgi:hypothetical protein
MTQFFCHFLVDNFCHMSFFATLSTDSKPASNSAFLLIAIAFLKKNFLIILALLTQTSNANADETAGKKRNKFFAIVS